MSCVFSSFEGVPVKLKILVVKKNGTTEPWDTKKAVLAAQKAASRAGVSLDVGSFTKALLSEVGAYTLNRNPDFTKDWLNNNHAETIYHRTDKIHGFVISALKKVDERIANSYQEFREYKKYFAEEFLKIKELADGVLLLGDTENANFDSSLVSTKGSLIKGFLTKSLYTQFYLTQKEKKLIKRGDIYIHDLRDMLLNCFNCCLFDMGAVLKNGFKMSNINYTEPNSVLSALQVIGDITLVATAQQFGGFTIPEIDKVLLPYCRKTFTNALDVAREQFELPKDKARAYAMGVVKRELEQGFQSLELKLNTVPCSRGDFAFTTITFGHLDPDTTWQKNNTELICLINKTILETRMKGHGGKQVVFPKLVYLYDAYQHKMNPMLEDVFNLAVECSSKCMYPDYLSLTGDPQHNVVAQVYQDSGCEAITSPMGCRAYLSPWKDPFTHKYVTVGRCNIGAVSLNVPLIMAVAKEQAERDGVNWHALFWDILDDRLEVMRQFLKKRYESLKKVKASTNPMCFMQGGLYNGYLKADDTIESLIPYMTASFGITALNESSILWNGVSIYNDQTFAVNLLRHIQKKIDEYKKEDGYLYALYGTPAESLCATQAKQYSDYTSDFRFGEYFSNSFHCHVSEKITPPEKQDAEYYCFHLCNGGHIQYIRVDNPENLTALKRIILRGMDMGFYQGVNFDAAYCESCKKHSTNVLNKCPYCGSSDIVVISRVCGYLGYSNICGKSRMNSGKMKEIQDRVSM